MKKSINTTDNTITFTFDGLDAVVFHADQAHDDTRNYAMLHGYAARIGDNAAIARKDVPGGKVTETMRRDAVMALVAHYESGSAEWETRTARPKAQNSVIAAIAEKRGITYAEAEQFLAVQFLNEME